MKQLNYLSVRQKILIIVMFALVGFAVLIAMSVTTVKRSNQLLVEVREVYYPVLEQSAFNEVQLERISEGLNTSVTIGDSEALADTDQQFSALQSSFEQQKSKLPELQGQLGEIENLATTYYQNARSIALSMIDGTADFSRITGKAAENSARLERLVTALASFKSQSQQAFDVRIDDLKKSGEDAASATIITGGLVTGCLLIITLIISANIVGNIQQVSSSLREIADGEGDLTQRIDYSGRDEFANLVRYFNRFLDKMQASLASALETIHELSEVADSLSSASTETNAQIAAQSTAIRHTSEALTEMFTSVKHIAEHAALASQSASETDHEANSGKAVVGSNVRAIQELATEIGTTASVIEQLESYTKNAENILESIRAIAEQTNLLALNAAIEAARAGEQGRGFAVVADEVRTLASRTQDSTLEIKQVLEELQTTAKSAVKAMDRGSSMVEHSVEQSATAGNSLSAITDKVGAITALNDQIATATEEQQQTSEQIQDYVVEIEMMANQATESTSELDSISQSIRSVTHKLSDVTSQFKV